MTRRGSPIYVPAKRICASVKGAEMTFWKPVRRESWCVVGRRS
jgi:hypothetical protein